MLHLVVKQLGVNPSKQRSNLAQHCNIAAQSTTQIENRYVILMAAIDPEALAWRPLAWRPLLQAMGLTVFNGLNHDRMGENPVVLISGALWRQSDWLQNERLIRRHFSRSHLCVLDAVAQLGTDGASRLADNWNDARAMLFAAGIDFLHLEGGNKCQLYPS